MLKQKWFHLVLICVVIILIFAFAPVFLDFPKHGDEEHFIETCKYFSLNPAPSLDVLRNYYELSTPLYFYVGGLFFGIFGEKINYLRGLNLSVAIWTIYILFGILDFYVGTNHRSWSFLSIALFIIFPYFSYLAVHCYPDLLCLFFIVLALQAWVRGQYLRVGLYQGFAILTRQFALFFPVTVIIYYALIDWKKFKEPRRIFGILIPIMMFLPLIMIWGGHLSPDNFHREINHVIPMINFEFPVYLISSMAFYLFPMALLFYQKLISKRVVLLSLTGIIFFLLFPPHPNLYLKLIGSDINTLGLFHKFMILVFGKWENIGMLIFYTFGFGFLVILFQSGQEVLFLKIAIVVFLIMNAFSHLTWDKYLLLVFPFILPCIQILNNRIKPNETKVSFSNS